MSWLEAWRPCRALAKVARSACFSKGLPGRCALDACSTWTAFPMNRMLSAVFRLISGGNAAILTCPKHHGSLIGRV